MKKITFFIAAITLVVLGCRRDYNPRANFTVSYTEDVVNEVIHFTNLSTEATSYEWDFDDGIISNNSNPDHAYNAPGTYYVVLSAFNHGKVDKMSIIINIYAPAELNIKVMEINTNLVVQHANVDLYETLADWDSHNSDYAVRIGTTDNYGIVIFDGLLPGNYYIDVYNAHYDNKYLGEHDVNSIMTPALIPGHTTALTVDAELVSLKSGVIRPRSVSQKTTSKNVRVGFHK